MSGGLWFYFWNEADWTGGGGPVIAPGVPAGPSRGGGHYIPLSQEFWMFREQHMRRTSLPQPGPYTQMVWLDWLRAKVRAEESAEAALRLSLDMDNDDVPPIF